MKVQELSRTARLILRDLSTASVGLYPFTIYRRYKMPPPEISKALRLLIQNGVVAMDDERASLTEKGRKWVKIARLQLWRGDSKPWRQCPEEFKQETLRVNSPYAPHIAQLDKKSFPLAHSADNEI